VYSMWQVLQNEEGGGKRAAGAHIRWSETRVRAIA
jgi:hypothetical protein